MCVFPGLSPPHSLAARLTYQRPWLRPPAQRLHNASAAGTQLNTAISTLTDAIFALSVIPFGTLTALRSSDPCYRCLLSHWLTSVQFVSPSDVNNWSALQILILFLLCDAGKHEILTCSALDRETGSVMHENEAACVWNQSTYVI